MFSGYWYIVLEGPDFAFTRTFYLTLGVPTTVIVSYCQSQERNDTELTE